MEWKELHQLTKTQFLHNPDMLVTLTKSTAESEETEKLQKLDDSLAPPNQLLNNQTTVGM